MADSDLFDAESVFAQLELNTGAFPEAALYDAMAHWPAFAPLMLGELRAAADDPLGLVDKDERYFRHLYALYLLAQFRETAAYPLLIKFLSTMDDAVDYMLGDVVTEDMDRILAAVCDGDLEPIKSLVENPGLDEFVRSSALDALFQLYVENRLERDTVVAYLGELFRGKAEREPGYLWCEMVNLACDLYPGELTEEIDRAYADGLVDPTAVSLAEVRETLAGGKEKALHSSRKLASKPIDDVVAELRGWACFNRPEGVERKEGYERDFTGFDASAGTYRREQPRVGRNDPCPCGSGKKYKKCCLQ